MELAVKTLAGEAAGKITLDDAIFGIEDIRKDLLHRTVRWQLAKRQAGTHKTQTRSEVSVTTKKFIRQKGSGGARHGSRNAPIFVGGGVAHGPRVRSHAHDLPKKIRKLALAHALSSKVVAQSIMVIDAATLKDAKTKDLAAHFAGLGIVNALIISGITVDENFAKAARNIPNVDVLPVAGLNVYDILRRKTLVITKEAAEGIQARFDGTLAQPAIAAEAE
jgi:large subunit ribosomal protein L4